MKQTTLVVGLALLPLVLAIMLRDDFDLSGGRMRSLLAKLPASLAFFSEKDVNVFSEQLGVSGSVKNEDIAVAAEGVSNGEAGAKKASNTTSAFDALLDNGSVLWTGGFFQDLATSSPEGESICCWK